MKKLERLEPVHPREIWPTEPEFTQWLAQPENLLQLGEEVGIDLALIEVEAAVGDFSADILAKDLANDEKIIIENQFGSTNHDHLGKIITYASGHTANRVIWIFENIREALNDGATDADKVMNLKRVAEEEGLQPPPPPKPLPPVRPEDIQLQVWAAISPLAYKGATEGFTKTPHSTNVKVTK